MHPNVASELLRWYNQNKIQFIDGKIADLGAFDINGSVKKTLDHEVVGFDILDGKGIDVKISPGVIPKEHQGQYVGVTSLGAFQTCPHPKKFIQEIADLLKPSGMVFLTMCASSCKVKHSTSNNKFGYLTDVFRLSKSQLINMFAKSFLVQHCYVSGDKEHRDLIYKGTKKE